MINQHPGLEGASFGTLSFAAIPASAVSGARGKADRHAKRLAALQDRTVAEAAAAAARPARGEDGPALQAEAARFAEREAIMVAAAETPAEEVVARAAAAVGVSAAARMIKNGRDQGAGRMFLFSSPSSPRLPPRSLDRSIY